MSIASRKVVNCDLPWISRDHVGVELESRLTCMLLEEVVRCNVGAAPMVRLSSEGTIQQAMSLEPCRVLPMPFDVFQGSCLVVFANSVVSNESRVIALR